MAVTLLRLYKDKAGGIQHPGFAMSRVRGGGDYLLPCICIATTSVEGSLLMSIKIISAYTRNSTCRNHSTMTKAKVIH